MRIPVIATFLLTAATSVAAAQGSAPAAQATPKEGSKSLTLSGCVQPSDASPNQFTFADDANPLQATMYRLSGRNMEKYAGKRVEIVGGVVTPRVKISGGLRPSPNVAGQAGAMDPTQAVIAGSTGGSASGIGNVELPEFRVKSVKPVGGACPQ